MEPQVVRSDEVVDAYIKATAAACAWLIERGEPVYARKLRDRFVADWQVSRLVWNTAVDELIAYANWHGDAANVRNFQEVRA